MTTPPAKVSPGRPRPLQTLLLDHLDLCTTQTAKGLMPSTARPYVSATSSSIHSDGSVPRPYQGLNILTTATGWWDFVVIIIWLFYTGSHSYFLLSYEFWNGTIMWLTWASFLSLGCILHPGHLLSVWAFILTPLLQERLFWFWNVSSLKWNCKFFP